MAEKMLPMMAVDNIKETLRFYEEKMGFEIGTISPNKEDPTFANVSKFGATLEFKNIEDMNHEFEEEHQFDPRLERGIGIILYIVIGVDIEGYYEQLKSGGVKILQELTDQPWGARTFSIEDLNGYRLCFRT